MGQKNGSPTAGYRLPQVFRGEEVFLLGGGPSLTPEIVERVRGRKTMAINSAARLAPWATILFFGDHSWFRDHRPIVDTWPGVVITSSRRAASMGRKLILVAPPVVQARPGISSGHHAVDVLLAMGARRIILLGFDCRIGEDGQSHCHADYQRKNPALYADMFLPAWAEYPERARKRGAQIINCSEGSAIQGFPRIPLHDILAVASAG